MKINNITSLPKYIYLTIISIVFLIACQSKEENIDKVATKERVKSLAELQHEFVNTRYQAYFHYNMCTFKNATSKEHHGRSSGEEPASMFAPSGLKIEEWVKAVKVARMEGGWLTTKHHGGFCLWDSEFTDYDVASSKDTTDIVKVFTDAFRKEGLKIGLYYSILDYHHTINNGITSGNDVQFIKNQITELLTNYGKIDYINFDGWSTWPTTPSFDDINYGEILTLVKKLQPECLIVSHTYESNLAHAEVPFADAAGRDYPYHPDYLRPTAASDFLQIDWWWDDNNDMGVHKSVDYILGKLDSYNSHNSVYILNISPNIDGGIDDDVFVRLKEVADVWEKPVDLEMGSNWGYQYNVEENLAFMKPCVQSSTHEFVRDKRAYPRAEIAVDGVTEGNTMMEQTSWTLEEEKPWWRVDLGDTHSINEITIFNRTDDAMNSLKDYTVSIIDAAGNTVWKSIQKEFPNPSKTLTVPHVKGRFVKIQLNGTGNLTLAEVIVKE
ncbi:alpha-L-fucosidase [Flavivirga rizhaonensis]|uniref:alpha-L-fucosidase n=1 Tax=Flavivirga rizhaonensis TaxID=2559571 RepID=A0A4S1E2J7_9FLAO|nr:alpha-L-fucosidase [Flavivirga rizhaonensis]TGV04198.1 glycoside hydrolase, family 29 [Flavivirga rizhaonensis]